MSDQDQNRPDGVVTDAFAAYDAAKSGAEAAREKKRKHRRALMLWWSSPVVLAAVLFAGKLISLPVINAYAGSAYDRADYADAASRYASLENLNWFEPYLTYFNSGTAKLQQGVYIEAQSRLEDALKRAPADRECDVRQNLSLSIEAQGDIAFAEPNLDESKRLWTNALDVLTVEQCSNKTEKNTNSQDRLRDKLKQEEEQRQQQQQQQGGGSGGGGGGAQPTPDPSTDPNNGGNGGGGQPTPDPTGDPNGGGDPTPNPTGDPNGGGTGTDGQGGTDKQQQLQDRNNKAGQETDEGDQRDNRGRGTEKNW